MLKKLSSLLGIFAISFAFVGCEPQSTDMDSDTTGTDATGTEMPGDDTAGGTDDDTAEPEELDEDATDGDN